MKKNYRILKIILILFMISFITCLFLFPRNNVKALQNNNSILPTEYSLRDDYVILDDYQDVTGLCWAFTSKKVLETTLAKSLNEVFDFSLSSVALRRSGVLGSGGNLNRFMNILDQDGISFAEDVKLQDLYYVENDGTVKNEIIRNEFKKHYLKTFSNLFDRVKYDRDNITDVKKHLLNYGALFVTINSFDVAKNNFNSGRITNMLVKTPNDVFNQHAVTVIGFDDNYKTSDNKTGAYICLNSDSLRYYDGINYLPYDSDVITSFAFDGLKLNTKSPINLISNSKLSNPAYRKYFASTNFTASIESHEFKNKNIFYQYDNYKLDYQIDKNENIKDYNLKVLYNHRDVTSDFKVTTGQHKITIQRRKNLRAGAYKLEFSYYKDNNLITENRQLFFLDGVTPKYTQSYYIKEKGTTQYYYNLVTGFSTLSHANNDHIIIGGKYSTATSLRDTILTNDNVVYRLNNVTASEMPMPQNASPISKHPVQTLIDEKIVSSQDIYFLNLKNKDETNKVINYLFPKIFYYDTDDCLIENKTLDILPFAENSEFDRFYLSTPIKPNAVFKSYTYLDENNNEQELSFDQNRCQYYLDTKLVRKLKTNSVNYMVDILLRRYPAFKDDIDFMYAIFIKPNFEENVTTLNLLNFNANFEAYTTLNSDDITAEVIQNGLVVDVIKPTRINYQNGQTILFGDKEINFEFTVNSKTYIITKNITVRKKQLSLQDITKKKDSLSFFYKVLFSLDGAVYYEYKTTLEIIKPDKLYFKYQTEKDDNLDDNVVIYSDLSQLSFLTYKVTANPTLTVLENSALSPNDILVTFEINNELIRNLKPIKIMYSNDLGYVTENDTFVSLEYLLAPSAKVIVRKDIRVKINKQIVDFTVLEQTFIYDGLPKSIRYSISERYKDSLEVTDNQKILVGTYQVTFKLTTNRYCFSDFSNTKVIQLVIKPLKLLIENDDFISSHKEQLLYSFDNINFQPVVSLAKFRGKGKVYFKYDNIKNPNFDSNAVEYTFSSPTPTPEKDSNPTNPLLTWQEKKQKIVLATVLPLVLVVFSIITLVLVIYCKKKKH